MRRIFYSLAIVFVVLIGIAGIQESYATECYAPSPERNFEEADVVFSGMVIGIDVHPSDDSSFDQFATVTFEVSETLKGETEDVMIVVSNFDPFYCGVRFSMFSTYLVYAVESNGSFFTDGDRGTIKAPSLEYNSYYGMPSDSTELVLRGIVAFVILGLIITIIIYFVYKIIKKYRKKRKIDFD